MNATDHHASFLNEMIKLRIEDLLEVVVNNLRISGSKCGSYGQAQLLRSTAASNAVFGMVGIKFRPSRRDMYSASSLTSDNVKGQRQQELAKNFHSTATCHVSCPRTSTSQVGFPTARIAPLRILVSSTLFPICVFGLPIKSQFRLDRP